MPFNYWIDELFKLDRFAEVGFRGLEWAAEASSWVEVAKRSAAVLGGPDPFPTERAFTDILERADKLEQFAKAQMEEGFPYLFDVLIVRLKSILDSMVDDIAVYCINELEVCKSSPALGNLEGPLLPFLELEPEERASLLLEKLKVKVNVSKKLGVGPYEAVFDQLGVGGPVHDGARRAILELIEVRNVVVHRDGRIDRRLKKSCPWITQSIDSKLLLRWIDYRLYYLGVSWYLLELSRRVSQIRDKPVSEDQLGVQELYAEKIDKVFSSRKSA